ncbi:rab-GTPase-TBC domain-containing protein [Massariosphaeria phaeospora]|uniref:Rab-GTPase-TBC domain-containing protein n=1 Tax=Massariosphaeria phaeospora TaxID=100035 RepID=A0A7C8I9H6_9PLEO|nr:rab-GTPase-TBC domain-containing protein [Massariosphaeria phaeospora]
MSSRPPSRTPSRSVSSASLPSRRNTVSHVSPIEQTAIDAKTAAITSACETRDLDTLASLATSSRGLINDSLRRAAWPVLLGCFREPLAEASWRHLPLHPDEAQVALDVNRAFVYYPKNGTQCPIANTTAESDKQLDRRKEELSDVIIEVLRRYPFLSYFQGYHDIVQVFLLVLARDAPLAVTRLSLFRIRDFMLPTFDPAIAQLQLLLPIIEAADPVLYNHIPKDNTFFALAGTITMFSHMVQEYSDISRLFDFFLAHDTVVPVYFFAAVILSRRDELLEIEKEDQDILHAILGKLPQPFDLEFQIARTVELHERLSPAALRSWAWWQISSSSVLKTTSTPFQITRTSLQEAEQLFHQQEKDLQRRQALQRAFVTAKLVRGRLWYYRRPTAYGIAVAVGIYAILLGRGGGTYTRYMSLGPLGDLLKRIVGVRN